MVRKTTSKAATVSAEPATIADVRMWARENGIEVASRGRIASTIREAFTAKTGRPISG